MANKNFMDVKPGDELAVGIFRAGSRRTVYPVVVTRLTKTLIITKTVNGDREARFRRIDGWAPRTSTWDIPDRLEFLDEEWVIQAFIEQRRANVLRATTKLLEEFSAKPTPESLSRLTLAVAGLGKHWSAEWAEKGIG